MNRPVTRLGIVLVLGAALGLGGCFKISKDLPPDTPAYVKLYPGAGQVVAIDVAGMKSAVFQAPAEPADIVAFYRTQAAADQLAESQAPPQANAAPGQVSALFGDPKGAQFLIVVARPQQPTQGEAQGLPPAKPSSMVDLTYKPAAKAAS
jgi:hypothetical protein